MDGGVVVIWIWTCKTAKQIRADKFITNCLLSLSLTHTAVRTTPLSLSLSPKQDHHNKCNTLPNFIQPYYLIFLYNTNKLSSKINY
jgi:hypothetical protein